MNIILFGPPGAGKGTQAEMIIEKFQLPHLSTGNIFRAAIKSETELGLKVKAILAEGKLVDDKLTVDLVAEEIAYSRYNNGAIFDGFPRTVYQAEALDNLLQYRSGKVDAVIVSHKPDHGVGGQLMEETAYGLRQSVDPEKGKGKFDIVSVNHQSVANIA